MTSAATIRDRIRLAVRHPQTGAALLARTFAESLHGVPWVDREMRLRFCILFLNNLFDGSVEQSIEKALLNRLGSKNIEVGIRLLRRYPDGGLRMLVALVMRQLREEQRFEAEDQICFCRELLSRFFPDAPS